MNATPPADAPPAPPAPPSNATDAAYAKKAAEARGLFSPRESTNCCNWRELTAVSLPLRDAALQFRNKLLLDSKGAESPNLTSTISAVASQFSRQ